MRYLYLLTFLIYGLVAQGDRSPNIIYILADDLGYGDLSCMGQKHFETPHIDRLAREGMLFTQHYSGATVCAPSRCSYDSKHTGHAVVGEIQVPEGRQPMPSGLTIPKMLKAGYVTGLFGKWGLGRAASSHLRWGSIDFMDIIVNDMHHYYPNIYGMITKEMLWGNFGMETNGMDRA